jgi:hypothetical protein
MKLLQVIFEFRNPFFRLILSERKVSSRIIKQSFRRKIHEIDIH